MATSPSFLDHVLELLSGVGPIRARRMFGGHGVALNGLNIAIISQDRLYLCTDEQTRPRFQAAGAEPFTFTSKTRGEVVTSYWSLPDEAVDDPDKAVVWGNLAAEVAVRKDAAKRKPAKKKPAARKVIAAARKKLAQPKKKATSRTTQRKARR